MRKLWRFWLNIGRISKKRPGLFFLLFCNFLNIFGIGKKLAPSFDFEHYLTSNRLEFEKTSNRILNGIEILIVVAPKDFELLNDCINSAVISQTNLNFTKAVIVVPKNQEIRVLEYCQDVTLPIEVVVESTYISEEEDKVLRQEFLERAGWVIQQLVKLRYLSGSAALGVLVVDADTLLLKSREWITKEGIQLLLVSEEYNPDYHQFLKYIGLQPDASLTFISHHMIFQPNLVRKMLESIGMKNFRRQLELLLTYPNRGGKSPFSIDYELYGQWIWSEKLGMLSKWSNIEIDRGTFLNSKNKPLLHQKMSLKWASVSLHSWRKTSSLKDFKA